MAGSEGGVYYIRQVGDCVWWFGTELIDIERGVTGQPGFANVASGRMDGNRIDVEFVDLPLGNVLGGGGLTLVYDPETDQLTITEQRGDWQSFGARTFTRINPMRVPRRARVRRRVHELPRLDVMRGRLEGRPRIDGYQPKVADSAIVRISSISSAGVSARYIASMITTAWFTFRIQSSSTWPGPWWVRDGFEPATP